MKVMGIDPGSNFMGLGCVEAKGNSFRWIGHEVVKVVEGDKKELALRLHKIFTAVSAAIELWQPDAIAIEEVFFAKNAQSALKLGQARGSALTAGAMKKLPIFEYSATLVKQTVAGSGRAEKEQVQRMIKAILGNSLVFTREDASDALAIAICHLQHRHRSDLLGEFSQKVNKKKSLAPRSLRG